MTQEQKNLLLKDLCARLPYGVKGNYLNSDDELLRKVTIVYRYLEPGGRVMAGDIKPYLFPLSSMTEAQINDCPIGETNLNIIKSNTGYGIIEIPWKLLYLFIDWCNKNHFDYRGLIPMRLANDATNLNIY